MAGSEILYLCLCVEENLSLGSMRLKVQAQKEKTMMAGPRVFFVLKQYMRRAASCPSMFVREYMVPMVRIVWFTMAWVFSVVRGKAPSYPVVKVV